MLDVPGARLSRSAQLLLVGSVFVAFGVLVAWVASQPLRTYVETRHWPTAPATLNWVSGDPESGWEPSYDFEVGGRRFNSHGADTAWSFPRELFERLSAAHRSGTPIIVLYDPANPKRAYVERGLSIRTAKQAFFGLPFASVGLVVVSFGLGLLAVSLVRAMRRARFPDRPWRWEPGFRNGRVLDSRRVFPAVAFFAGIAVVVFVGSTLGAVALSRDDDEGDWDLLVPALFFGVISLGLLAYALRSWAARRRDGVPVLSLPQLPLMPGSKLRATAWWPGEPPKELTARLVGERIEVHTFVARSSGTAPGRLNFSRIQREVRAVVEFDRTLETAPDRLRREGGANGVELEIQLPDGLPERQTEELPGFRWRLELLDGGEPLANFELPVFRAAPDAVEVFEPGFPAA